MNQLRAVLFLIIFTGIGVIAVFATHAATPSANVEAESGTTSGGASVIADTSASAGHAVKFGGVSVTNPLSNFFPIGVFVQPTYAFNTWKSRGVNTLVDVPSGNPSAPWDTAAVQAGLYELRTPDSSADVTANANNPNILGWTQPDEPDGIYSQVPYTTIQNNYTTWKPLAPNKQVYINFIGSFDQYDLQTGESGFAWYQKYAAGADWISADAYPSNGGKDISQVSSEVDMLHQVAGSKPVFAFIETTDINVGDGNPGPTAAQFRAEVWQAIIHGVRGIWYFPEQISPSFAFDTTPASVVTEMTAQDATISQLAPVLQGTINPSNISATVSSPLQVAWRSAGSGKYFFVLNLSNTTLSNQTIHLTGVTATSATVYNESRSVAISGGTITDTFGPYAVHIYQAAQ